MDRIKTTKPFRLITHLLFLLALVASATAHSAERITYYHNDNLGSPVAATDTQGNVVWRESYQPDGTRIQHQGDSQNKLWFTGKQEESSFGVSYFGARWYDSEMGRFLAMDPVGVSPSNPNSFNRYAYANNNPYRFTDHDGRDSDDLAVGGYWTGDDIGRLTGTDAKIPDEVKTQTLEVSLLMLSDAWIADVAPGLAVINAAATSDVPLCVVPKGIAPSEINFSQRTVSGNVEQYVRDMKAGNWDWSKSGPIRIMQQDGKWVSYDNRRLMAAQQAGLKDIPYEVVDPKAIMPGSKKTWEQAFRKRFNDRRNLEAGGAVPSGGISTQPSANQ